MKEYLAKLVVNDCENGECLEKVQAIFVDEYDEFEDCEDFGESMEEQILECLKDLLEYDYKDEDVVYRVAICELMNDIYEK